MRRRTTAALFCAALTLVATAGSAIPVSAAERADLCAQVGRNAGFPNDRLVTAVAVALAESSCNPSATGHNNDPQQSIDRGLWQINSYWHPEVSESCAYEPQCNANNAYRISAQGTSWTPWSTYNSGAYQSFLGEAQAAVNRLGGPGRTRHDRDFSGDGFGDMVTISADGYLDYYPNNAATNPNHLPFTGAQNRSPNPTWGGTKIAAGDFSGDGVADLLVRDDTGHLCIYPNNASSNPGGNPFIGASWCSTDTNLANIKQLAAGDVSGDGYADMVIIDDQGRLQYYPNNAATNPGHVPFISAQTVSGPTWGDTKAISLGDVSGDGAADLYAVTGNGTLDYYPNNAATNPNHDPFRNAQIVSGPTWGGVNTISLTDISGDGSADLLCVDNNDGYLHYYPNNAASNPNHNPFIGEAWHSAGPTWTNARLA